MRKWLAIGLLSCGVFTQAWARLDPTAQDAIAGWNYALLKDDTTGQLTSDANLTDAGGRGFMSIGCARVTGRKPAVFILISPQESLGLDGEPGRITYRVGKQAPVQSGGTFRKAVWKGQLATYILPETAKALPRMLRTMTEGPSMEVQVSPKIASLAVQLHFPIGDVKLLYHRIEKDCPGFIKSF